jgi:hypothetical protein
VRQESIDAIRALDESDRRHSYWHFHWKDEGSHWFIETVDDNGEEWPVKQLVAESDGSVHRYWWDHMEDAAGMLGDQALDPSFPGIETIPASTFFERWENAT